MSEIVRVAMSIDEQKKAFAIALLSDPKDPFKCAQQIFGPDVGMALRVYGSWPLDPDVIQYQELYLEEFGDDAALPTKTKLARDVYDIAEEAFDPETRLKALKLYGDVRGFIEKPGMGAVTNIQQNTKVIIMTDHGTDKEWEAKLLTQQAKLTDNR